MGSQQLAKKRIAPESLKTAKVREKLKKHWVELDKKITPEALKEKTDEIHQWIARHAHVRVPLRNKSISLFDKNQHAAKTSQRIVAIAQQLCKEMQQIAQRMELGSQKKER